MMDRRAFLCGSASLTACATSPSPPPTRLRDELDTLSALAPRERQAVLHQHRHTVEAEDQILFAGLWAGVEAEARLTDFSYGVSGAPYAVTHRNGAYMRAGAARTEEAAAALASDIDADTARIHADAARGIAAPSFIRARTLDALTSAGANANHAALQSAIARQRDALLATASQANDAPGVWALPEGELYASLALQLALGKEIDPADAHRHMLTVAHALQAEADSLLRSQGLTEGDVASRLRAFTRDPRFLFEDDNSGRDAAVAYMNERLARMRTLLPQAFNDLDHTPAEVRRMSVDDETRRAAGRREGAAYFVALSNIRARARWTLPSVVYHELLPGHLLQAPLQQAAAPHRLQLRYASGYSEGWAVYAEILADEIGGHEGDPVGRLGYLQWLLFRIARVIVDTGVHTMRWSRERGIAEMRALQGDSIAFISIEEDTDRIIVQPGVYAAQGIAALEIKDLRESKKRRLGARFDLARFHDSILKRGPLSPNGLARAVALDLA